MKKFSLSILNSIKPYAFALLSVTVPLVFSSCASAPQKTICHDRVKFTNRKDINFNSNEDLFLCGDDKRESWKEIPFSQIEYSLRNFLAERAYYEPKFTFANDILTVDPGVKRLTATITYEGEPEHFFDIKQRDIIGSALNSSTLDTIENWANLRLRNMGYACPTVKTRAIIDKNLIVVRIVPGPQYQFTAPRLEDPLKLYPWAYSRFNAFVPGSTYTGEWIQLSQNRAVNDGIVVSSQITAQCPQDGPPLTLNQKLIGGDPRLITVGVGASTEEFPLAQASWKSVRMDQAGSNLNVVLYGSQRIQRANVFYVYYAFKNFPRLDWSPAITFERDREATFTSSQFQIAAPLTYSGDWASTAFKAGIGPAFNRIYSEEVGSNKTGTFTSIIANFMVTTHDYELYSGDPRSGYTRNLNAEFLSSGIGVSPLATILKFTGSDLFQINPVYPVQWVLGFRYSARSTLTTEVPGPSAKIPAKYFHTLGGDQDMRGFGRDELTGGSKIGGLTALYAGTEFRYAKSLPLGIEPFGFFDMGMIGNQRLAVDSTLYYSPGIGIRWATPFGAIRSTLAHGYLTKDPPNSNLEHFQFFISFGKEF